MTEPPLSAPRSPSAPRPLSAIILCLAALALLTWLDLWTKHLAVESLSCTPGSDLTCRVFGDMHRGQGPAHVIHPRYLELRYAENPGGAFSILHDAPDWLRAVVFGGAAVLFIGMVGRMFLAGHGGALFAVSVPLIVSGAIGNLVDRARLGYVVDFIRVHIDERWSWPTFNVADITIAVGAGLLLLDLFRARSAQSARPNTAPTPPSPSSAGGTPT